MKLRSVLIAAVLSLAASASHAGGFVELTNRGSIAVPVAAGNNQATDPMHLASIGTLSLLDTITSPVFFNGIQVGSFLDAVYRDTTDQKLVFGSQLLLTGIVNGSENQAEVNDIFRSGFTGYSAAVAWAFVQPNDRGPTLAARTAVGLKQGALVFNPDVVDFRTDINVSEGNPDSALYLVKTDANSYAETANAVRLRQGGEEGQPLINYMFAGYVPTTFVPPPPPIPEPGTWALMLSGLVAVIAIGRKRLYG